MSTANNPPNFKTFFENVQIDENGSLIVAALSASYASSSAAGFPFTGYARITGSMDITQNLIVKGTASIAHVQYQTSSIIYASGSTKFGDTADDTHQFTGSMMLSGMQFTTNNQVRWVPTHSINGPGLSIQVFSSSSGTPRWEEIGYFAE